MSNYEVLNAMADEKFRDVCWEIAQGLGFMQPQYFEAPDVQVALQEKILRKSTDEMLHTEESWMLAFARTDAYLSPDSLDAVLDAATLANIENLLTIVFGMVDQKVKEEYHALAKSSNIKGALLSDTMAVNIACDYVSEMRDESDSRRFSFINIRESMMQQAQQATWRKQFQSLTALPARIKPKETDSVEDEADLFRALNKTNSFLLLGDPGAGRTTSLLALAEELAHSGGRTPVLMPLNRYNGNLLNDLGEVFGKETEPLSEDETRSLLSSGAFTVMLDGLNEVQPLDFQDTLIEEINRLTNPQSTTARSQWIVSGRKYDYRTSRHPLKNLENHTWELQPLTSDLIYHFLVKGLGDEEGEKTYKNLGPAIRQICSNPLLLNMVLTVRLKTGEVPMGRGGLYHQFIDMLLDWGVDRNETIAQNMKILSELDLKTETYNNIARQVLVDLAEVMTTTAIEWQDARDAIVFSLIQSITSPQHKAKLLLDNFVKQGILKEQRGRVSFFHHTFQEYFQAFKMKNIPISELIPEGGVQGAKREAIIFLAAIIESPNALIERALHFDSDLAYQIERDAANVEEHLQHDIAATIWEETISQGKGWIGSNYTSALKFADIAKRLDKTPEALAREVRDFNNENEGIDEILQFYQELGDLEAQQEIVEKLGFGEAQKIPDNLLFQMAILANDEGNKYRAIELYTEIIQKYPNESNAYGNRANAYKVIGETKLALDDYQKAIELQPDNFVSRTNYANLLSEIGQQEEAIKQLKIAIQNYPKYASAHESLAKLLKKELTVDLEEVLYHFEQAAKLTITPKERREYLQEVADIQEKLCHFGASIASLRQLIELDPTSPFRVSKWKRKIAFLRIVMDEEKKRTSIREQLLEQSEVSLAILADEMLKSAGLKAEQVTSQWILTRKDKSGLPTPLPVALLDVPQLTGDLIRKTIESLPPDAQRAKKIVLLTATQNLEHDARIQLFAYQPQRIIALITSVEVEDAILQGERECYELLANALNRAETKRGNPFTYTSPIREPVEFFGRNEELTDLTSLIQDRQPFGLYGIHKIGKSSLLRQIRQGLTRHSRDITSIWIELDASIKNISDLYRRIMEKAMGEIEASTENIISTDMLRRSLTKFQHTKERSRSGHQILLIIDEYPYLIPDRSGNRGIKDYLEALAVFKTLSQEGWFNILPCGRTSALSRTTHWKDGENPFIGILREIFLGPLVQDEATGLVKTLGAKAGIHFEDDALDRIFTITGGHPFFSRGLGAQILKKQKSGNVTVGLVEEATHDFLSNAGEVALLRAIYETQLDQEEQRIVKIIATNGLCLPKDLVPENADRDTRNKIRDAVNNLLDTTVLQKDNNGKLNHRYELLRRIVQQEIEEWGF